MASLTELINLQKYQTGYHGDGPSQKLDFSPLRKIGQQQDQKQATALKLLQYQAAVQKAQADAAIAKRKQDIWNMVGTPAIGDKSTAGDVSEIVDTEKVGGRDANVSNRGDSFIDAIPQQKSNNSLVNLVSGLTPKLSAQGDLVLAKKPKTKASYTGVAKHYDEARTFNYAQRLADQSIIADGKVKKDIAPEEYSALVKANIGKAEKYLYGKQLTQEDKPVNDSTPNPLGAAVKTAMDVGFGKSVEPGAQGNAPQVQAYTEGQTAINPKTGKRLAFKGGKWQPIN